MKETTMTIRASAPIGKNGSVQMIRFPGAPVRAMYQYDTEDGQRHMVTLKKTWIGQILQVFVLRLKYR
jgi:hypothetical protein